ncbi:MAG TPA: hypothetical protein VKS03_10280 [Thermoanaerobaculia bacterium]|nr:hypothetical protein [Thermoanaerobaculia bacterium]
MEIQTLVLASEGGLRRNTNVVIHLDFEKRRITSRAETSRRSMPLSGCRRIGFSDRAGSGPGRDLSRGGRNR